MKRARKTRDCGRIYVNYGQGWEHECTEFTWKETKVNLRAYRENQPYPVKAVFGRDRIEEQHEQTQLTEQTQ